MLRHGPKAYERGISNSCFEIRGQMQVRHGARFYVLFDRGLRLRFRVHALACLFLRAQARTLNKRIGRELISSDFTADWFLSNLRQIQNSRFDAMTQPAHPTGALTTTSAGGEFWLKVSHV